jgi:hypothetical protein
MDLAKKLQEFMITLQLPVLKKEALLSPVMLRMAPDPQVSPVDTGLGEQSVSTLSPGGYSREQLRANLHGNMARMMRYVSAA